MQALPDIPVFIINLARDTERRRHMEARLRALGMQAIFTPAVDGRALTATDRAAYDPRRANRIYGGPMMDTEIACYLSHYRIYERMIAESMPVALIMEDDLDIADDLRDIVHNLVAHPFQDWTVMRLQSPRAKVMHPAPGSKFHGEQVGTLPDGRGLYRLRTHVLGACAYIIKLEAARRMVEYGARIFMPIDHTMDRYWENGVLPYVVRPFPVCQGADFSSSIGDRSPKIRPRGAFLKRLPQRGQRLSDGLAKRLFWLRRR